MPSKKLILVTGSSGFIGSEVVNKLMNNKKVILYLLINKNKKKNIRKTKNIKFWKYWYWNYKSFIYSPYS